MKFEFRNDKGRDTGVNTGRIGLASVGRCGRMNSANRGLAGANPLFDFFVKNADKRMNRPTVPHANLATLLEYGMNTKFLVLLDDVTRVPSDVLLLKHAAAFYGVDSMVALTLERSRACSLESLSVGPGEHVLVESRGAVASTSVLYLGTRELTNFRYSEMKSFAAAAVQTLADRGPAVQRLVTTIHGAGYGLDPEESLLSLIEGFENGLRNNPHFPIPEIVFVESSRRRGETLIAALNKRTTTFSNTPAAIRVSGQPVETLKTASPIRTVEREEHRQTSTPPPKKHVFVAMPFSDDFEDVYEFGIYAPIRNCGLICEKTSETAFTGDILQRIRDRISTADLVVADLTEARPNVYLEVGYAWGKEVPVVLIARQGEQLHFDVSRHRCLYYKSIRQLAADLEKLIRGLIAVDS